MSAQVALLAAPFDPGAQLNDFARGAVGAGAIATFTGLARPAAKNGTAIEALVLESHPTMTLRSMETIAAAAMERFALSHGLVIHREGRILPGEPIVFVATASAHRRAAFEAADYLMDRLKSEAVFWKREDSAEGRRWIEPTDADRADMARWQEAER